MDAANQTTELQRAAQIFQLSAEELSALLEKEFVALQRSEAQKSKYPSTAEAYSRYAIEQMISHSANPAWLEFTTKLLHRDTDRRFYFDPDEVVAVSRILDAIEGSYAILNLSALGLDHIPFLVRKARTVVELTISDNRIQDLTPVSTLPNLRVLMAANNQVSDISCLEKNTHLESVDLSGNLVRQTLPLAGLRKLRSVNLRKNLLNDSGVRALLSHPSLEQINVQDNFLDVPVSLLENVAALRAAYGMEGGQEMANAIPLPSDAAGQQSGSDATVPEDRKNNAEQLLEAEGSHAAETAIKTVPDEQPAPSGTTAPVAYKSQATRRIFINGSPEENLLDVEKLSAILYDFIADAEDNVEQFFGLFGRWGRGKTYFWNFLREKKLDRNRYIPVEFHAWKYQDTPGLWAYLYSELNKKYFEESGSRVGKMWRLFRLNYERGKILKPLLLLIGGLSLSVAGLYLASKAAWFESVYVRLSALVGFVSVGFYALVKLFEKNKSTALKIVNSITNNVQFKTALGLQCEIQEELRYLLKAWLPIKSRVSKEENGQLKGRTEKRIFLFIDDIDRCSEDKIIQIVDYIRVLLHDGEIQARITVLAAIDERILVHAIQNKYRRFIENKDNDATYRELCREYMDKLFLTAIKLGPLTDFERVEMLQGFSKRYVKKKTAPVQQQQPVVKLQEGGRVSLKEEVEAEAGAALENATTVRLFQTDTDVFHTDADGEGLGIDKAEEIVPVEESNMKRTNGSSTVPIQASPETTAEEYALEDWEDKFLRNIVARKNDLTPRSIRVYMYRYLLGKKLIEKPLRDGKPSCEQWYNTKEAKQCFALKLFHYSFTATVEDLYTDYNGFVKNYNEKNNVTERIYGLSLNLNQELGSIMYQVLTMIVAY